MRKLTHIVQEDVGNKFTELYKQIKELERELENKYQIQGYQITEKAGEENCLSAIGEKLIVVKKTVHGIIGDYKEEQQYLDDNDIPF